MTTAVSARAAVSPNSRGSQLHARLRDDFSGRLAGAKSTQHELARWRVVYPALAELHDLAELRCAVAANPNAVFVALLDAHQRGSDLAGAALLDAMLPKLLRMTRYARVPGYCRESARSDRAAETIAAFLSVIASYRPRAGHNVAAELALRTLRMITVEAEKVHEIPCGSLGDDDKPAPSPQLVTPDIVDWDELPSHVTAMQVLNWAVDRSVISADDRALITEAYLRESGDLEAIARTRGISHAAVRQRLHRSVDRLRVAVCAELGVRPVRQAGRMHIRARRSAA